MFIYSKVLIIRYFKEHFLISSVMLNIALFQFHEKDIILWVLIININN